MLATDWWDMRSKLDGSVITCTITSVMSKVYSLLVIAAALLLIHHTSLFKSATFIQLSTMGVEVKERGGGDGAVGQIIRSR